MKTTGIRLSASVLFSVAVFSATAAVRPAAVFTDGAVRYKVKFECTHPNAPKDNKWLRKLVNGRARAWGVKRGGNDAVVKMTVRDVRVYTDRPE